jgi:hypothetical protein
MMARRKKRQGQETVVEIYVDVDLDECHGSGTKEDPYRSFGSVTNKALELHLIGKRCRINVKRNGPHSDLVPFTFEKYGVASWIPEDVPDGLLFSNVEL